MIKNKTWAEITDAEIEKEKQLSPEEKLAVENVIKALRGLSKDFCLDLYRCDGTFTIQKRITPGFAVEVRTLKKKSLFF